MRCPACGQHSREEARFCDACGSPLTTVASDRLEALRAFVPPDIAEKIMGAGGLGERRIVTVLFCDIVGSTALGERLGPQRYKIVMDQVLGRIITAVARYEGTVAQVMGDGLLTFFGAPLAHEDDAERAVRAALDIRDAVAAYSKDLETTYGLTLQVRIGLNTGPIVLSEITDVVQIAYNALGDTVTTAARLQTAAQPGTILVSEVTGRLVTSLFELRPAGPLALKGKEAPVRPVEVLAQRIVTGKVRGIAGLMSPIVGRERELNLLQESVRAVTEGRGQIVSIIGEPGIGKSRLVAEVQRASHQMRWLEGRSLSYAGTIPYFPFLDLFREWLGVTAADHEAKVRIELHAALDRLFGPRAREVYPYFGALLRLPLEPDVASRIADLSAESVQHQTFKVIREWAVLLAKELPLALILDDLHWADETSLVLLEGLFDVTEEAPVLFCLLLRPEREHGSWRINFLAGRRFPHRHVEIVLQPLAANATKQLLTNLFALPEFPKQISDLILEKAEGNPFFVEEVIRELIEVGILIREGDRWRAARPVAAIEIPDNILGVLLARIDRLPHAAKHVLQAASVIGRLFELDVLKHVLPGDSKPQTALTDLQRHDLIVERRRVPQAEYQFRHALTQEVAYGTLTEEHRRHHHNAVARALEAKFAGRLEQVYGLLAYHYDRALDEERALTFLVHAGDKARGEYADQEALQYYARAVEVMKHKGEWAGAAQALMKMALAHHIAFDFRAANAAYQEAFDLSERLPPATHHLLPPARLRWAMTEPAGVDTARCGDSFSAFLISQLFDGLLRHGPGLNVAPALARSWEISDDGTRYRFHLHQGSKWSDGRPVTAHDFVFTWLRAMQGVFAHLFYDIAGAQRYYEGKSNDPATVGVRALGDYTLEVTLEGPRAHFPFIAANPGTAPHPRWAIERYGDNWTNPEHLVTNGPYVISEWIPGRHIRLQVSPYYTSPRKGNIHEAVLVFEPYPDPAFFERGEVDVHRATTTAVGWVNIEKDIARYHEALKIGMPDSTGFVYFRCDRPPFDDRRVRLAFAHATNRQALARSSGALTLPADGGLVPPAIPGHSPHIGVSFDPDRARYFLTEAGYRDGRGLGPLALVVLQGSRWEILTATLTQVWQEVLGVQVAVQTRRWPDLVQIRRFEASAYTMGGMGWTPDYPDPDCFLRLIFHSTSESNVGRWKNQRFDSRSRRRNLPPSTASACDFTTRLTGCLSSKRLQPSPSYTFVTLLWWRRMSKTGGLLLSQLAVLQISLSRIVPTTLRRQLPNRRWGIEGLEPPDARVKSPAL